MAAPEKDVSENVNKRSEKNEKKAKKRKRKHQHSGEENSKTGDGLVNGTTKSPEDTIESEQTPSKAGSEDISFDSLLKPNRTTPHKVQPNLKLNPFKVPSPILKTPKTSAATGNAKDKSLETPPTTPPPLNSSAKKVVQFNDDSSDDDPDWSPRTKRRKSSRLSSKLTSTRHSQSPNGTSQSPKKVHSAGKLASIRRDLLDERMKLPIWTGIPTPTGRH